MKKSNADVRIHNKFPSPDGFGNSYFILTVILLLGIALRLYTASDPFLHEWDERYHALVAKNLIDNPSIPMLYSDPLIDYDYKNWSDNHIWLHKPPFPLYAMAFSMWLFGIIVFALRLPSLILSCLGIFYTYKIGQHLFSKKIGLIAAFLFSINGLIIEQTAGRVATDHIDVFFYSLICLSLYYLLKSVDDKQLSILSYGSIFAGLAVLSKWLPGLIVLPVWLAYQYPRIEKKRLLLNVAWFVLVVGIIVIPWHLYIFYHHPQEASWERKYNLLHFSQNLQSKIHHKSILFHFDQMRIIFGELVYLPMLWFLYQVFRNKLKEKGWLLFLWIFIPYIVFSLAHTKMPGYILICAPAIFMVVALFYDYLDDHQGKIKWLSRAIMVLLIILPIRYSLERIKPFQISEKQIVWKEISSEFIELEKRDEVVLFNTLYPIETMFTTDIIAYKRLPTYSDLERLLSQDYTI